VIAKFKYFVLYLGVLFLISAPGLSTVSVNYNFYNDDSSLSNSLAVENGIYSDYVTLTPDEVAYAGGGSSKLPDGSFSQSISYAQGGNKKHISSSVKTTSGSFGWSAKLVKKEDMPVSAKMGATYGISDGNADVRFTNNKEETSKYVTVTGGSYKGGANVNPDSLVSAGQGELSPSGENNIQDTLYIEDANGKWGWIDLSQIGNDIRSKWMDSVQASADSQQYGMAIGIGAEDGKTAVEITGDASNFPMQHLPPGNLEVNKEPAMGNPGMGHGFDYDFPELYPIEDYKDLIDYYISVHGTDPENTDGSGTGQGDYYDPSPQQYHPDPSTWENLWKPDPIEAKGRFNLLLKMDFQTPIKGTTAKN
jgi:hypothetical protein